MNSMRTLFFILISFSGISQVADFKINPDCLFTPDYYAPKIEFHDTILSILTKNNLIDSSSIIYESSWNLESVRKNYPQLHSEGLCFFIDSVYLDSVRIQKVKRRLVNYASCYGDEYFQLTQPIYLSLDYFYYGFSCLTKLYEEPFFESKEVYFKREEDELSDILFPEIKVDEFGREWVRVSFNYSRYDRELEKKSNFTINRINSSTIGWTLLNYLHIGYYCPY